MQVDVNTNIHDILNIYNMTIDVNNKFDTTVQVSLYTYFRPEFAVCATVIQKAS